MAIMKKLLGAAKTIASKGREQLPARRPAVPAAPAKRAVPKKPSRPISY
jgi:hypothetical protein